MANTASNLLGPLPAAQLSGTLPASALAGYAGAVTLTNASNCFNGSFFGSFGGNAANFAGNGSGLTNLTGLLPPLVVSRVSQGLWYPSALNAAGITNLLFQWDGDSVTVASNYIAGGFPFTGPGQSVISYAAQITNFALYQHYGVGNSNYANNGDTFAAVTSRCHQVIANIHPGTSTNYVCGMLTGLNDYWLNIGSGLTYSNAAWFASCLDGYHHTVHGAGGVMVAFTLSASAVNS